MFIWILMFSIYMYIVHTLYIILHNIIRQVLEFKEINVIVVYKYKFNCIAYRIILLDNLVQIQECHLLANFIVKMSSYYFCVTIWNILYHIICILCYSIFIKHTSNTCYYNIKYVSMFFQTFRDLNMHVLHIFHYLK